MTYYVAALGRFVLVEADNEDEARTLAKPQLYDLFADVRANLGRDVPIDIHTVRPATTDEIDMMRWHEEMVATERADRERARR